MFIRSMSSNESEWGHYHRVTLDLDMVTPYQRNRLLSFYNTACNLCITATGPRTQMLRPFIVSDKEVITDSTPGIKVTKVIHHNPATIIFWSDGTKTVVKCDKNDTYDPEKGFYIACAKKLFGNNYAAVGRINKALEMAEDKNE